MTEKVGDRPSYLTAVFLGSTAFVFLNFGLPIRADDLGIDAVAIGGMYATFTGTMLLVRPLVGYCLDRYGRRWFFTTAFVFYSCSMFAFSRSSDIGDFYFARFLQGIGASLMWVSARTMVADLNEDVGRGRAMGVLTSTSVRGSLLGALYGFTILGFMPMQAAWLWAFSGYALAAALALVWSVFKIRETTQVLQRDQSLITAERELVQSVLQIDWSGPLRRIFLVVFLSAFASALIEPIYLIFLRNKFDLSIQSLAVVFLPAGAVYAILPQYAGQWSDRFGRAPVIAIGVALAGLLSIALPFWNTLVLIAASYMLFAVGWAMANPAEDALVADLAPPGLRGTVMGAREAAAGTGAALGPLAGGYIYENWAPEMAFVVNGALLLVAAALVVLWFRPGSVGVGPH